MRIWIDLANAPHVGFFLPLVKEFTNLGHEVSISVRDFNQTVELARRNGLPGEVIGTHGGASSLGKLLNLLGRSVRLARFGRKMKPDVAVSHNSYTHTIAGRCVGARVVTIMDYEGQPANHIAFRTAHRVIVPFYFPDEDLRRFGAGEKKVWKYQGFKEQVYLSDFRPCDSFLSELTRSCGLDKRWDPARAVLVTVRTPASMAAYHHFKNLLFERLLLKLDAIPEVTVVLLPRSAEQKLYYREKFPRFRIPTEPLSGNDLVYHSDLVISAGGTMNREAAVLGTPVCTIFAGELPAVDRALIGMGRLTALETDEDLNSLCIGKKERKGNILVNHGLCREIAQKIISW